MSTPVPYARELVATVAGLSDSILPYRFPDEVVTRTATDSAAWVVEGRVCDVLASDIPVAEFRARLKEYIDEMPVDIIIQPVALRRKKLLVADMESTIIQQEMLDELAKAIGVGERVADITRRAMNGELDFEAALRERVGLLKGQPESLLTDAARRITLMPGAAALLNAMKRNGAKAWLVSGGFMCFADAIGKKLGFDRVLANELIVKDGVITGDVTGIDGGSILDKNSKRKYLQRACIEYGIGLAETLTIGDGANDVPMLSASNDAGGLGVAYHAKPKVREAVPHQINFTDLSTLINAQGLR